jgi:hypothetical protein
VKEAAMSFELSFRQEPNYLIMEVSGQWTTDNAKKTVEALHDEAVKQGLTRLLVDMRGLSKPSNEMTRFLTGEHVAKILRYSFKVAVVAVREIYSGFAETVALNRGANMAVFFDEATALEWLLEGPDTSDAGEAGQREPR